MATPRQYIAAQYAARLRDAMSLQGSEVAPAWTFSVPLAEAATHEMAGDLQAWIESRLYGDGTQALREVGVSLSLPAYMAAAFPLAPAGYFDGFNLDTQFDPSGLWVEDHEVVPAAIFAGLTVALGGGFGQGGLIADITGAVNGLNAPTTADLSSIPADIGYDFIPQSITAPAPAAPLMPPAVPETVQQLTEWGLREVSPGYWSQPALPSLSPLQMSLPEGSRPGAPISIPEISSAVLKTLAPFVPTAVRALFAGDDAATTADAAVMPPASSWITPGLVKSAAIAAAVLFGVALTMKGK